MVGENTDNFILLKMLTLPLHILDHRVDLICHVIFMLGKCGNLKDDGAFVNDGPHWDE